MLPFTVVSLSKMSQLRFFLKHFSMDAYFSASWRKSLEVNLTFSPQCMGMSHESWIAHSVNSFKWMWSQLQSIVAGIAISKLQYKMARVCEFVNLCPETPRSALSLIFVQKSLIRIHFYDCFPLMSAMA